MARKLISSRTTVFLLLFVAAFLWYYWGFLFPKQLDNTDIVMMRKDYYKDGTGVIFLGIKNVSKTRPNQYKDFLPKVAAQIADTTHGKMYIYFLIYDHQIEHYAHIMGPDKLEEEEPDAFLLWEYWSGGKEPDFVHWYIPALKSLNTEVPDLLHLEDTRVEHVK